MMKNSPTSITLGGGTSTLEGWDQIGIMMKKYGTQRREEVAGLFKVRGR